MLIRVACGNGLLRLCDKYSEIRGEYVKKNAIVLQPLGIEELGEQAIVYNLAKHIYETNDEITDEANIFLVQNHIDRFRLNSDRFSPSIIDLCVKIVSMIESGVKDTNNVFH